jgi:HlyD family secretion protein
MSRARWFLMFLLLIAVAGSIAFFRNRGPRPIEVDVEKAQRRAVFRSYVTASGEIVAARYADIGSSAMGKLVQLAVKEGDAVRAGQVLARLDAVPASSDEQAGRALLAALEAERAAAVAREVEARQALERTRALSREGVQAQADVDRALAAADSARAAVEAAERRVAQGRAQLARMRDSLAKTEITAPMDGVVTRLAVREGEMVVVGVQNQPGTILMTLSDLSSLDAEVKVAEVDVVRLALGKSAEVTLEALPGRKFGGRVIEIGASSLPPTGATTAAREFRLVVRLDAPDPALKPGMTCDAAILAEEVADAVVVPLQAVTLRPAPEGGERAGVFVVGGERRVTFTPVTPGVIGGLDVVVDGVADGTAIVAGPFQALRTLADGATITPRGDAGR